MRFSKTVIAMAATALVAAGCSGTEDQGAVTSDGAVVFNDAVPTEEDNLSTFAVDIDTASYEYARDSILNGRLPQQDTVRPEEFVNAFAQDYEEPDDHGFTVTIDGARTPDWYATDDEPSHIMRVGLQTKTEPADERTDAHLTFVIDTSGSMNDPARLPVVQESLHLLVDQLRPGDAVALVTYSDEAEVLQPMTPVSDKAALHTAIDELATAGSTNVEDGLRLAYQTASDGYRADAVNRVILLSDGLPNVGSTEHEDILATARDQAAAGITLLCVGVGTGYGDQLMEQLADNGDGFAVYFSTATQAKKLFEQQLAATLAVRAKDAKVQVAFDTDMVEKYRLIGFENRDVADEDFTNDAVDGGEVGPGHHVTALYAVTLTEQAADGFANATVRWLDPDTDEPDTRDGDAGIAAVDVDLADASPRLAIDLVAGAFAELLRGGEYAQAIDVTALAEHAAELATATEDADVAELADLIVAAAELMS